MTELSSEHEQSKAYKKQRIETIEKEQKKLHALVHGQIWVKVKALEGGNKEFFAPLSQKIEALEQEIELLRGPIMIEGRNLIAENQTLQREIVRMQEVYREIIINLMQKLEEQFDKIRNIVEYRA